MNDRRFYTDRHFHLRGIGYPQEKVPVTIELFCSLNLALHEGKPEIACQWVERTREMSFSWHQKRGSNPILSADQKSLITRPITGATLDVSLSYDAVSGKLGRASVETDWKHVELDDQPDMIDISPPFV